MSKLALFGGPKIRTKLFPAYRTIGREEEEAVIAVMRSGVLSRFVGGWHPDFYGGPQVQALEREWSEHFGAKHAIAVNSATSGLYCAVGAIGAGPGDEIIVSPYTMSASATAPLIFNAIPVFADIEEDYLCLSADSIEERITPATRAIIVVDIFGQPYDADRINAIAEKHDLWVIEDAAQAPHVKHRDRFAGTLGDIGIYSLNYHKHIHAGEGGIIVTDNDDLAERMRLIRNHAEAVVEAKGVTDLVNMIGFNFRMNEIEAAITREQLKKLPSLIKQRQDNVSYLSAKLSKIPCLEPARVRPGCDHAYYMHILKFDSKVAGMHRNRFVEAVRAELPAIELRETEGVKVVGGYVKPLYLQPMFQMKIAYGRNGCPFKCLHTFREVSYDRGICPVCESMHYDELINHELMRPGMGREDLDDFVAAVEKSVDESERTAIDNLSSDFNFMRDQHGRTIAALAGSIIPIGALLVIAVLVYGLFIPSLGFYQDDWPLIWVSHSLGAHGFIVYFKGNREMCGKIFSLVFPILGTSIFRWHVAALLLRWLSTVFLFTGFRKLWPGRESQAWLLAVFALLYPGFGEQPMAVTFLPHHLSFLFITISFYFTILAIRAPAFAWVYATISLLTASLSYLVIDYFVGLEFFRPAVMAVALGIGWREINAASIKAIAIKWSPYALVMVFYAVWRLFLQSTWPPVYDGMSQLSGIAHHPLHELLDRITGGIENLFLASAVAWSRIVSFDLVDFRTRIVQLTWGIGLLVFFTSLITLRVLNMRSRRPAPVNEESSRNAGFSILILGLVALVVGGLPINYANLRIAYDSIYLFDRFSLSYLLGASLLLVGICQVASSGHKQCILLAGIFIFFATAYQIRNENDYRHDWDFQRNFFWQQAWRAPALNSGTTLFVDHLPFSLRSDHSAGLLDLLYDGDRHDGKLDYFMFDLVSLKNNFNLLSDAAGSSAIPSFKAGKPIIGSLRSFKFSGSTSSAIVIWNSPSGTVRFVSGSRAQELSGLPPSCRGLEHLSRARDLVTKDDRVKYSPLLTFFGSEPIHGWTFYYQKADLDCDLAHWGNVAKLGDEVGRLGFTPKDPNEWIPFIEGYAMSGNYDRALEITEHVLQSAPTELRSLSSLWTRIIGSQEPGIKGRKDLWDKLQEILILSPDGLVIPRTTVLPKSSASLN